MKKKKPTTNSKRYTHTMEYYSIIKKNELLPFSRTWIDWKALTDICERERKTNAV